MSLEIHELTHEALKTPEKFIELHKKRWIRNLDKAIIVVSIMGPLMTIPQIYEIWVKNNASGVSFLTWGMYCIMSLFWIFYGISHKDKAIIINQSLWMLVQLIIVFGILFK